VSGVYSRVGEFGEDSDISRVFELSSCEAMRQRWTPVEGIDLQQLTDGHSE
jgi:hypothetical protein